MKHPVTHDTLCDACGLIIRAKDVKVYHTHPDRHEVYCSKECRKFAKEMEGKQKPDLEDKSHEHNRKCDNCDQVIPVGKPFVGHFTKLGDEAIFCSDICRFESLNMNAKDNKVKINSAEFLNKMNNRPHHLRIGQWCYNTYFAADPEKVACPQLFYCENKDFWTIAGNYVEWV